jgi:hypothetical protein
MRSSGTDDLCEKESMHQNRIRSKGAKSFRRILAGARMARLSSLAAFALGMAGSLSPEAAHAQEYPWCVSRKSYSIAPIQHMSNVSRQHRASANAH